MSAAATLPAFDALDPLALDALLDDEERLIRDNVVVNQGKLSTLKRFKDEVREVVAGQECGMAFEGYQDMRQGDVIECFQVEQVKRTL